MGQFNFDPINFGLGLGAGILSTLAVQRLLKMTESTGRQSDRAVVQTFATREADKGYLQALLQAARQSHLMGKKLDMDSLLIEPRFIPAPLIVELQEEGEPLERVFDAVPRIDDYPLLHAVYNMPTLSIAEISRGHKSLVLVGTQGSGRTTALLTIALWSAGYIDFTPPDDEIAQQYEASRDPKKDLPIVTQAERVWQRIVLAETRAEMGKAPEDEKEKRKKAEKEPDVILELPSPFRSIAPLYVNMVDLVLSTPEYGRQVDPAEPLIRALQHQSGYVAARRLVNKTYKVLEAGSALVLIDGYDDLPVAERPAAIRWVKALMAMYPDNFYIVAMPPDGYGLLMEMGAMPIYLRPWNDQMIADAADKWQAQWETLYKQPIQFDADKYRERVEYSDEIKKQARQLHVFDVTMHILSRFKGKEVNQSEQMQLLINELLPDAPNIMPELERLAAMQLDKGYITLREMVDEAVERAGIKTATQEVQKAKPSEETEANADEEAALNAEIKKDPQRRQIANEQGRLLRKLVKSGLLIRHRRGRYQFRHKFIASYLAARTLIEAHAKLLIEKLDNGNWDYAMNYLAQLRDVDFLVAKQLEKPLDIMHEHILKLTNWLKFAGKEVSWRGDLLRYLGNLLAAPHQFTLVRERVAAALINAKDDGALAIFSKVIQTQNPDSRRVACLALGVLRAKNAVNMMSQMVLQDQVIENKIAGALGLYAIGSLDAVDAMIDIMDMTPHDEVRRVIAESFAADRTTGYPTLYDMLNSESISMRRAALFGLGRIETDWALLAVDRPISKGDESFVRLAADVVERKLFEKSRYLLPAYPIPTEVPWLMAWAEEQRDAGNIPYDMPLEQVFDYAVEQEHDGLVRWLATGTVGQIGEYRLIDKLYLALQDRQEMIRNMAYRSLGEFQQKLGKPLPSPI